MSEMPSMQDFTGLHELNVVTHGGVSTDSASDPVTNRERLQAAFYAALRHNIPAILPAGRIRIEGDLIIDAAAERKSLIIRGSDHGESVIEQTDIAATAFLIRADRKVVIENLAFEKQRSGGANNQMNTSHYGFRNGDRQSAIHIFGPMSEQSELTGIRARGFRTGVRWSTDRVFAANLNTMNSLLMSQTAFELLGLGEDWAETDFTGDSLIIQQAGVDGARRIVSYNLKTRVATLDIPFEVAPKSERLHWFIMRLSDNPKAPRLRRIETDDCDFGLLSGGGCHNVEIEDAVFRHYRRSNAVPHGIYFSGDADYNRHFGGRLRNIRVETDASLNDSDRRSAVKFRGCDNFDIEGIVVHGMDKGVRFEDCSRMRARDITAYDLGVTSTGAVGIDIAGCEDISIHGAKVEISSHFVRDTAQKTGKVFGLVVKGKGPGENFTHPAPNNITITDYEFICQNPEIGPNTAIQIAHQRAGNEGDGLQIEAVSGTGNGKTLLLEHWEGSVKNCQFKIDSFEGLDQVYDVAGTLVELELPADLMTGRSFRRSKAEGSGFQLKQRRPPGRLF